MIMLAALKLQNGTIYTGRFSHAKAMYSLLKEIPNPSQELLDNILEGFLDEKTDTFYTRDEYKLLTENKSLTSQKIV